MKLLALKSRKPFSTGSLPRLFRDRKLLIGSIVIVIFIILTSLLVGYSYQAWAKQISALEHKVNNNVAEAQVSNRRAAHLAVASINRFFSKLEARKFHQFIGQATGFGADYDAICDAMPWSSGHNLQHSLANDFTQNVLSQKTLEQQLKDTASTFTQREAATDGILRRTWIEEWSQGVAKGYIPASMHIRALVSRDWMAATSAQLGKLHATASSDAMAQIDKNLGGLALGSAISMGGIALGVTADGSIMGVGAAGAPETLGASMLVAGVATVGFNIIYDAIENPDAKMRRAIVAALEKMRKKILYSNANGVGLKVIFEMAAHKNSKLCQAAAKSVIRSMKTGG